MRISDWSSDVCSSDLVFQPQDRSEQLDERLLRGLTDDWLAQREQRHQLGDFLLIFRIVIGIGLEQDNALGILVAEQRQRIIRRLLQIAEGDNVTVGLDRVRSEEHTSELQSLMRSSY